MSLRPSPMQNPYGPRRRKRIFVVAESSITTPTVALLLPYKYLYRPYLRH